MTVFNTTYSTIEEAWADSYLSPSLQKKPKKKKSIENPMSDPICDLYEMGNNSYDDSELVSYANKFYEKHEKAKYQNAMMNDREKLPKVVDIDVSDDIAFGAPFNRDVLKQQQDMPLDKQKNMNSNYIDRSKGVKYEDDEDDIIPQRREKILYDTREYYGDDDDEFGKKNQSFNYFDIALYIISGIILIFMMDQFVKIGMLMK